MNNVQDYIRHYFSTAINDGCAITDNLDGTVSIASGEITVRHSATDDAELMAHVVPAQ
jgi:hypothetical protein